MTNIKQTLNNVVIEGQLSEVNLEYDVFNGNDVIKGSFSVRVPIEVNGKATELDVPVRVFHSKITKAGKSNPAFNSINTIMTDLQSIAAVGEEEASFIRVTGADVRMQEYYPQGSNDLVSYPSISGSFVNPVNKNDALPKANWEMELYIHSMNEIVDGNGEGEEYLEIQGIGINYDGSAQIVPIKVYNKKIASQLQSTFSVGQTVPFSGILNFTSRQERIVEEALIGEPVVTSRTISVSEIILTGARAPLVDAYTSDQINDAVMKRKAKLEAQKQRKAAPKVAPKSAPTQEEKIDLGF